MSHVAVNECRAFSNKLRKRLDDVRRVGYRLDIAALAGICQGVLKLVDQFTDDSVLLVLISYGLVCMSDGILHR